MRKHIFYGFTDALLCAGGAYKARHGILHLGVVHLHLAGIVVGTTCAKCRGHTEFKVVAIYVEVVAINIVYLLGESRMIQERYIDKYSMEKQVSRYCPPTFIALASDDKTVPAENSIAYYERLVEMEVPVEMHIWKTGGHGWGFSSEKNVGRGNDKLAAHRKEFYIVLERWLESIR
jgi:acetyl esterase/lipase